MSTLANTTGQALKDIKEAIKARIVGGTSTAGKVWTRIRYADNLAQWLDLAAIEEKPGVGIVRVTFVYLSGFSSDRVEFRQRKITATYAVEIIQGFEEGTDEDNSTDTYEALLGDLEDAFSQDDCLGFSDPAGQAVENSGFQAPPGENEGKPVYVDGILSHRIVGSLTVSFRQCTRQ